MCTVENGLSDHLRDQEEQMEKEEMIEGALASFLAECFEITNFVDFMAQGLVSLADLEKDLLDSAEFDGDYVRFWARSPEDFVKILVNNYLEM